MKVKSKEIIELLDIENSEKIGDDENLIKKFGFSSIEIINFIINLEKRYSMVIDISDMSIDNFSTINAIKRMLKKY